MLDSSKLKKFADNNFQFDEGGGKFLKTVKNTAGKGEIASNKQFLPFPQFFQETCFGLFGKGLRNHQKKKDYFLPSNVSIMLLFSCLKMLSIWKSLNFCHLVKSQ